MKKNTSLLLAALLCFSGCDFSTSSSTNPMSSNSNSTSTTTNSTSSSKGEIKKVVLSVAKKTSFVQYETNKEEKENKKDEFIDRTQNYQVGDDNNFNFMPYLTTSTFNTNDPFDFETKVEAEWEYNVTLEKYTNDAFVDVVTTDFVDSIDTKKCLVDFNDTAIGETFKLVVIPLGLSENQDKDDFTIEYEFTVVDGYNVYSPKELAYIANREKEIYTPLNEEYDSKAAWITFKEENGLLTDFYPSTMILHNDLVVTETDIPKEYLYSEEEVSSSDSDYGKWEITKDEEGNSVVSRKVVGSLKDWVSIYPHEVKEGTTFTFSGNYFKLDLSKMPTVVRENNKITSEGQGNSHSELFRFYGDEAEKVRLMNFKVDGNAPKNNDVALSGGLIFTKGEGQMDLEIYNNITIRCFIPYFKNKSTEDFIIEKCRSYDNFNCFVYLHGSKVLIKDSEFIGSGGPAILKRQVGLDTPSNTSDDYLSDAKIVNSTIESKVTGSEGWFKIYGVDALVPAIKSLDTAFNMFGRTFLTKGQSSETYFNLISVNSMESDQGASFDTNVRGSLTIDDYTFDYGATNPYLGAFYGQVIQQPTIPPVFETNAGGFAYLDPASGFYSLGATGSIELVQDPTHALFQGTKIALYYNSMQIVFDYYPLG